MRASRPTSRPVKPQSRISTRSCLLRRGPGPGGRRDRDSKEESRWICLGVFFFSSDYAGHSTTFPDHNPGPQQQPESTSERVDSPRLSLLAVMILRERVVAQGRTRYHAAIGSILYAYGGCNCWSQMVGHIPTGGLVFGFFLRLLSCLLGDVISYIPCRNRMGVLTSSLKHPN